jgi:hypothetical protein
VDREYQAGKAINFSWDFYSQGIQEVPSTGTVTVYNNAGTQVATSSVSIDTTGRMTYTLSAGYVTEARNYRVNLEYTVSGTVKNSAYLFDVVKYPLRCEVSDNDLFIYLNELRDKVKEKTFSTSAIGTVNTIVSSSLTADNRDYKGGYIDIFITATDVQTIVHQARITAYSQTTGTATFTPSYSAAIAADATFSIRPSFQQYIDNAFNMHIIKDLRNKVKNQGADLTGVAGGYIDSTVVNTLVIYKTLELYCFSQIESNGDKWDVRYQAFKGNYSDELEKLNEPFDRDNDGNISDTEDANRPSFSNLRMVR